MVRMIFSILIIALPALLMASWEGVTRVSLVSDVATVEPGEPFRLGVHLELEEGWHVYWKNPGDAGLETHITFSLP